jgi:hypothetical protein
MIGIDLGNLDRGEDKHGRLSVHPGPHGRVTAQAVRLALARKLAREQGAATLIGLLALEPREGIR